ncbi:MAG: DUF2235 domain-containing protein [Rhodopseudomonas sp.]|nr:DUF2235 domain-containing protein [Rhodopseudomonas sp.]
MGRKIILLSDGTGNSSAKVWRTNVWRVFECLDLSGSNQIAFYDDGVGTSSFKPAAILGGAFGFGLKRNVVDIYKFACRNWRNTDDEIFGFGFSRGAFTMRIVIGLIAEQGLVRATSELELDRKAKAAYRDFRRRNFHTIWRFPEAAARWLRDAVLRSHYSRDDNFHGATIRFVGVWDTVAAYGTPVEEMTRGISQWLFPLLLPDLKLDRRVVRACHALSVDDERTTFHPTLWDERDEEPLVPRADGRKYLADERISQVWFAGVHANVGGGYPDDSLAQIPLIWIMSEASAAGLTFKSHPDASPQTLGHSQTAEDKDGRIYDPRSGLGGYYRYGPRDLTVLGQDFLSRRGGAAVPRIHESVLARVKNYAHVYAPKGLPEHYEIVTPSGEVLPVTGNPYEAPDQARARANTQEKVWNTVWLKRIVYFLTVAASIDLVAFPLQKALPANAEYETKLRWVSDSVRLAGSFLPNAADTWLNGYARNPSAFLAAVGLVSGFTMWGGWLGARIQNRMGICWFRSVNGMLTAVDRPRDIIYRLRTSDGYKAFHNAVKKYVAPALFAICFVYFGVSLLNHFLYVVQDDAGWVCRDVRDKDAPTIEVGQTVKVRIDRADRLPVFRTNALCQNMRVTLMRGGRYLIKFNIIEPFMDGNIEASMGFYTGDPPNLWQRIVAAAALPNRRELLRPWFRVVARIGSAGGEETFLDPDPDPSATPIEEVIRAKRDGQLFLFVNDVVIGIPGLYSLFYDNNLGAAEVTITRRR